MRIGIVNDSKMATETLRQVLRQAAGCEVVWTAENGADAVAQCAKDTPDVILMDLVMPVMNGVEATCKIMRATPCPILIVTAATGGDEAMVFESMGCGALDAFCMPTYGSDGILHGQEKLLAKITTIGKFIKKPVQCVGPTSRGISKASDPDVPPLVAIGASTGGPKALAEILGRLPADFKAAIAIVQHVDTQFVHGFAEWLGSQAKLPVRVAGIGDRPLPGTIAVAGSDRHMVLNRDLEFDYTDEPRDYPYKPSVDTFFESVSACWPTPDLAVLMTGMGKDGARGLAKLHAAGWHTIAQDEATSVVYGMPKAAVELKAADEILPLEKIAEAMIQFVQSGRPARKRKT